MEHIREEMGLLTQIIKGIAAQFGEKCEVVLHDLTGDYEHTIVAIENAHITGRRMGDCGSNLGLEVLRGSVKDGDRYNYVTQTKDGKILRSTSIYLKNKEDKIIGAICMNLDISDLIMAENALKSITMHSLDQETEEVFVNDVSDLLDYLLQQCQNEIGKPVSHMSKEEKIKAIQFLDKRGAFLIKKAGDKVCQFLDISKFTLYNYLDEVRGERMR
ncbi:helix-turn-helix transcriptional regulator [Paenibacillus filicis]|uniref:Helix-turn-helix transcriptional regulator n=1 Tax=Paenibacillus gyeongsangnamensis TaxID=3388067 RepID=A0ABT4Q3P7_9BACL|nr:helix-turn-helix transcriptional regulator [Paenibacillus filicis]MCZ8511456.1 helix-turn-helix transcriptional regulator [Paenibacillus filicis]